MDTEPVRLTEVLAVAPDRWPKRVRHKTLRKKLKRKGIEVVYEDDLVVAFHQAEDDYDSPQHTWRTRVVIAPKNEMHTLMDLGVADEALTTALLHGIQQVALKLNLHKEGFEIRADVLPPYQQVGYLRFKVRAGKRDRSPEEKLEHEAAERARFAELSAEMDTLYDGADAGGRRETA
jgi:hypothetical protein